MWRRIYFSFPAVEQAKRVVAELEAADVDRDQIHAIARSGVDVSELPVANAAQCSDRVWFWEQALWYGNLAFFVVALAVTILALYADLFLLAVVAGVLALAAVVIGERFAVKIPHVHLSEMRVPFAHGEVILLVDVPHSRVHEIEQRVSRHHPEAGVGGVGWTIASAGI